MSDIFIGRQPVFDQHLAIFAYELLFRAQEDQTTANIVDADIATSQVILNCFADIGIKNLVGRHFAFINMTRYFLENPDHVAIPPGQVILDVPQDLHTDDYVMSGLSALKSRGHTIALENFVYDPALEPLIELVDIIKIDVENTSELDLRRQVSELRHRKLRLLAMKVESYEQFERLKQLDFDFFQGHFFSKPSVIKGKALSGSQVSVLRVIAKVFDPDLNVSELSAIIGTDVSLSHKIMKFINASANGLRVQVDTIKHAVVLLGINTIKNWATLIALTASSDKPDELCRVAIVRARCCEQLARKSAQANPDNYFTLGLFSTLEAMMDASIAFLLEGLPLSSELKSAAINGDGTYGKALECVMAMEVNDPDKIHFMTLTLTEISEIYLEAIAWADEQLDLVIKT